MSIRTCSLSFFVCMLLAASCVPWSPTGLVTPATQSEVLVAANVEGLSELDADWTAHIVYTRGRHSYVELIPVQEASFSTSFSIPVGTWTISLVLLDGDGVPTYQDSLEDVTVFPNTATQLGFELRPADGTVTVVVDLTNYPQAEDILRVRVHFDDVVEEIQRDGPDEPLSDQYTLAPGSYDFKVELFTESFRASDRVDPGIWHTIDVKPLEELSITWQAAFEQVVIDAEIFIVPRAPEAINGFYDDDLVTLTWTPSPSDDVTGYSLYVRENSFFPFELLATLPNNTLTYTHDVSELDTHRLEYCVAAVQGSVTGYRSPPCVIEW